MNEKLIRRVWEQQPGNYYFTASKEGSSWKGHQAFDNPDEAIEWLKSQPDTADLYWCITGFNTSQRVKEQVSGSRFLWADLDTADPHTFPKSLKPTIAWESSPGRYHGLWELDRQLAGAELEQLNKDLTYRFVSEGADPGGWDFTQVLRVPGTPNHKYPEKPIVKLLWDKKKPRKVEAIRNLVEGSSAAAAIDAPVGADSEFNDVLSRTMKQIPRRTLRLLLAEQAEEGKRSDVVWALTHQLTEAGIAAGDIEVLIKGSVWNKYRGRNDEDKRIRHEVASAVTKTAANEPTELEYNHETDNDPAKLSLTIVSDDYLMMRSDTNPGWLVKDWWTRNSYGIVAGEPKSFKSFLVQDMAISVASGIPFLGEFPVHQPGPVMIVQNENAPWIIKNRAEKIRASKGLVGSVTPSTNGHIELEFPGALPIHYINQSSVVLDNPVHQKLLYQAAEQIQPVLVVFDPLYLMLSGDISNAKDLNPVLTWLLEFKQHFNCSLMVIHHMHKAKNGSSRGGQRMLGSVTLHGWVESAWYLDVMDESEDEHDHRSYLKLEREFRGTASPHNARIGVHVGEWDSFEYSVTYDARIPNKSMPRVSANSVAQFLETRKNESFTLDTIADETTLSKKAVQQALDELIEQGSVAQFKSGYRWKGR